MHWVFIPAHHWMHSATAPCYLRNNTKIHSVHVQRKVLKSITNNTLKFTYIHKYQQQIVDRATDRMKWN